MSFSYTGFRQHVQDHRACGVKFMLMLKNVVECKKMIVPIMMNKERRQRWIGTRLYKQGRTKYYAILIRPLFIFHGMSLVPCT